MQKKKILHLVTGLEIGGTETTLLKILPLLQEDFDNHVCCIVGHGPIGKQLEASNIPVHYIHLRSMLDFGAIFRFRNIVKQFRPDVLVTYLIHADLFGRIFGRMFGIKKIVCSQRGKLLQWEFLRIIDRATKFLVTKYTVQTETAKQELMQKLHLPEEKFEIIPNAVDMREFNFDIDKNKKRSELHIPQNNTLIVCVSRLRNGKGHEYLLDAFEKVYQIQSNLSLLIVGDGERRQELMKQTEDFLSKKHIHFLGNRTDVKEILKITDIFVLPTLGEGMSNAIMEAMAAKLPIITTNIPENKPLIEHKKNGILVPPQSSESIASALEYLLHKNTLLPLLGKNAYNHVSEQFSLQSILKKLTAFLKSII